MVYGNVFCGGNIGVRDKRDLVLESHYLPLRLISTSKQTVTVNMHSLDDLNARGHGVRGFPIGATWYVSTKVNWA